jgi:hypothetical protein
LTASSSTSTHRSTWSCYNGAQVQFGGGRRRWRG